MKPHKHSVQSTAYRQGPGLSGKRVLVVEDDYFLATEVCRYLADLGAVVLGPAPTPFYALGLLGRRGVDVAVLDVRLHGTDVYSVAEELMARQIPIVFATAYADDIPKPFKHYAALQKPISAEGLLDAIEQALAQQRHPAQITAPVPSEPSQDQLMRVVVKAIRLGVQP